MALYTVELLDQNGNRLAHLQNAKAPTFTRRRNQAVQVTFQIPAADSKASLINLATRFKLYRRGVCLFGGIITKRNLAKDPWAFEGFSREIDLETMLTPAAWDWRDMDLADIFRDLVLKFKVKRWALQSEFEMGTRVDVDTATMPGNVILQKRADLHYPASGYLTSGILDMVTGEVYAPPAPGVLIPAPGGAPMSFLRPSVAYGRLTGTLYGNDILRYEPLNGALLEGGITNSHPNPSVETALTGWSGTYRCALTRSTDRAWHGSYSGKIVATNPGTGFFAGTVPDGTNGIPCTGNQVRTHSFYVWSVAGNVGRARLEINQFDAAGTYIGSNDKNSAWAVQTGVWERLSIVFTTHADARFLSFRLRGDANVAPGDTYYVDACMAAAQAYLTTWHDSTRTADSMTIPTVGWAKGNLQVDLDFTPTSITALAASYPVILRLQIDANNYYVIGVHPNGKLFVEAKSGGLFYDVFTLAAAVVDTKYHLTAKWDGTNVSLFLNGIFQNRTAYTEPIGVLPATASIAPFAQANGLYSNLRVGSCMTDEEIVQEWAARGTNKATAHTIGLWLLNGNLAGGEILATRFERLRWAERIGAKVHHTFQFRSTDLREYEQWPAWSSEMSAPLDPLRGIDLIDMGLSAVHRYVEIKVNLLTDDTETPQTTAEGQMPTAYGVTPILGPFELVWREPSGISAAGIPASLGIQILEHTADRAKHLAVASELAEQYEVEFKVDADGVMYLGTTLGTDRSGEIVIASGHNANIQEIGDALADVVNVLTVLGAGDGIGQLQTVLEDADSKAAYGERCGVITNKDIYLLADLLTWGGSQLAKLAVPDWKFSVKLAGLPSSWPEFGIGDTVTAVHPTLGIRVAARILEEQRREENGGESITLGLNSELDVAVRKFFKAIAEQEALVPQETVPVPAPTGLLAQGHISEVALHWVYGTVDNFEVFHSYDGTEFGLIDTVPGSQKTYTHKGLAIRSGHYYKVRAVKDGVPSALSQVAYAFVDRLLGTAIEVSSTPASVFDVPMASMIGRMGRNRIVSGLEIQTPDQHAYELTASRDATVETVYERYIRPTRHDTNAVCMFDDASGWNLLRPYIGWDLAGVIGTITYAYISLFCTYKELHQTSSSYWPKLQSVSADWTEEGITWENQPNATDIMTIDPSLIQQNNRVIIEGSALTTLIQNWRDGLTPNHGIRMMFDYQSQSNRLWFSTRHDIVSRQPLLVIHTQQAQTDCIVRVLSGIVKVSNCFYEVPAFEIEAPDDTTSYLVVTMEQEGVFSHQFKPTPDLSPNDVGLGAVTTAGGILTDVEMSVAAGRVDGAFDWGALGLCGTLPGLPNNAGLVYVGAFRTISTTAPASWTHNMGTGLLLVGMLFKDNAETILQMCSIATRDSGAVGAGVTVDLSNPNVITAKASSYGVHYNALNSTMYTQGLIAPIFLAIGQCL